MKPGPKDRSLDCLTEKLSNVSLDDDVKQGLAALEDAMCMVRNEKPATRDGMLKGLKSAFGLKSSFKLLGKLLATVSKLPTEPCEQDSFNLSAEDLAFIIKLNISKNTKAEKAIAVLRTIADLYFKDSQPNSALLCVILSRLLNDSHNHEDLICKIIESKSDVLNFSYLIGLFHRAVEIGNIKIVGCILDKIALDDHQGRAVAKAIHIAIDHNQTKILDLLLDPDRSRYEAAQNAFIKAAGKGLTRIVLTLINSYICQYGIIVRQAFERAVQEVMLSLKKI